MTLHSEDDYYLSHPEPARSCLLALRRFVLTFDPRISETSKWGMPCFCFEKRILCYLWSDKKTGEPYILMAEGRFLTHPALETGSRIKMKILRVRPDEDLPVEVMRKVLTAGINLFQPEDLKKTRL